MGHFQGGLSSQGSLSNKGQEQNLRSKWLSWGSSFKLKYVSLGGLGHITSLNTLNHLKDVESHDDWHQGYLCLQALSNKEATSSLASQPQSYTRPKNGKSINNSLETPQELAPTHVHWNFIS